MNKLFGMGIVALLIIAGFFGWILFFSGGNTVVLSDGTFHVDGWSPTDEWGWFVHPIRYTEEKSLFPGIFGIGDTGIITIKGVIHPSEIHYPQYSKETYEATYSTNRRANEIAGSNVGFNLKWDNVNIHEDEFPDGMWFTLKLTAYETTNCIPFTDLCWGERPLPRGDMYYLKGQYVQDCLEGTGPCVFPVDWPDFDDTYWHQYDGGTVTFWLGRSYKDKHDDDPDVVEESLTETGILTTVDRWEEDQGWCFTRANLYKGGGQSTSLVFEVDCSSSSIYNQLLPFKTKEVKITYNKLSDGSSEFLSIEEI